MFDCLNSLAFCGSGLSMESETVLCPVETDTESHRPLMSDEEDEVEVYSSQRQSIQQPSEPLAESSKPISFCQAFLLPGVLPVSPPLGTSQDKSLKVFTTNEDEMAQTQFSHHMLTVCASVFPVLCVSEAGQLLLLLLASFLPEQQLRLERG